VLDAANGTGQVGDGIALAAAYDVDFKLTLGSVYEVCIPGRALVLRLELHADARELSRRQGHCTPTCGNGVVTSSEECDNGASNSDTAYGGCTTQCKWGAFCGDGVVNGPEQCDDGRNTTVGYNVSGCGPDASSTKLWRRYRPDGEECDNGKSNQDKQCGGCSSTCQLNPTAATAGPMVPAASSATTG